MNKIAANGGKCWNEPDDEPKSKRWGQLTIPVGSINRPYWGRRQWNHEQNHEKSSDTRSLEGESSEKPHPGALLRGQKTEWMPLQTEHNMGRKASGPGRSWDWTQAGPNLLITNTLSCKKENMNLKILLSKSKPCQHLYIERYLCQTL